MMLVRDLFKLSLHNLLLHKVRSILTSLGVIFGVGSGRTITYYTEMPTIYSAWSIALALAISSITGVIFGTYPAYKAAQQNPITVLRAE